MNIDVIRRSAERGLNLAIQFDIRFLIPIFQHILDELNENHRL